MTAAKHAGERHRRLDGEGETEAMTEAVLSAPLPPPAVDQGSGNEPSRQTARRAQAVRDRLAGMTYSEIAERHHYSDGSAARKAVVRALDAVEARLVDEYRTIENARLDLITLALTPILVDVRKKDADRIAAAGRLLAVSERRARLNGLDAPVKVQVSEGAMATLEDALREFREAYGETAGVVLGEVTDSREVPEDDGRAG